MDFANDRFPFAGRTATITTVRTANTLGVTTRQLQEENSFNDVLCDLASLFYLQAASPSQPPMHTSCDVCGENPTSMYPLPGGDWYCTTCRAEEINHLQMLNGEYLAELRDVHTIRFRTGEL